MATLNIASKANQATTFPALMVAHYAKEADPNSSINVNFEEVDTLKAADNATVEVVVGTGTSTYGSENVIDSLVEAYPFLQGKHDTLVSHIENLAKSAKVNAALGQRMARQNSIILPHRLQVCRWSTARVGCSSDSSLPCRGLHSHSRRSLCLGGYPR